MGVLHSGLYFDWVVAFPPGAQISVLSYYINYNGDIYAFHGVSRESEFNAYQSTLELTMRSLARLSDQSKINVIPARVEIKTVQRTMTLREAFTSFGVPGERMDELALLNNMELDNRVSAGRLIKIVE